MAVHFGFDIQFGDGTIGLTLLNNYGSGCIHLSNIPTSEIGKPREGCSDFPTVGSIQFKDVKSIDVVIEYLQRLRTEMDLNGDRVTISPTTDGNDEFEGVGNA